VPPVVVVLPVIVVLLPPALPVLPLGLVLELHAANAQTAAMAVPTSRDCGRMTSTPSAKVW
jgi:hypothetical protein